MDLKKLAAYFPEKDLEWRAQQTGIGQSGPWARVFCYVTNRAIMERLDEVAGPGNWKNEFKPWVGNSQLCGISIRNPDTGEWVTKWDGSESTDVEPVKGGLSASMKRAAVQWGIGRYLYNLDTQFAECAVEKGKSGVWTKAKANGNWFFWRRPSLERIAPWALPPSGDQQSSDQAKTS